LIFAAGQRSEEKAGQEKQTGNEAKQRKDPIEAWHVLEQEP
jgi:hypothetical protein